MGVSRAALPRRPKSSRAASAPRSPAAADPVLIQAGDPFVVACLRRLLADDRATTVLMNAGAAPAARRAGARCLRVQVAPLSAYRQGRVAQPAVVGDWRAALVADGDGIALRRRYPLIVALLRELANL